MALVKYIHILYAIIVWAYAFIFIKPRRIRELLPVGILAFLLLFGVELYLSTLGLYRFNDPILPIMGIPLFHLIWGAGSGIVFVYYIRQGFWKKILALIVFTLLTMGFENIAEALGAAKHLGKFTQVHDAIQDLITLIILLWFSQELLGGKLYGKPKR